MSDRENVISGLQYTVAMFLFDPATGYSKDPDDLNAADRITFDACKGAIDLLKEQEAIVRCKDCQNGAYVAAPGLLPFVKCGGIDHELDWFCADGKRR